MSTNSDTLTITNTLKAILIVPYDTKLILDIIHKFNPNNCVCKGKNEKAAFFYHPLLRCGDI
ncbi:MAG: hypothetical protein WA364_27125 [Candidatus Nitrosopolaris sp.]